MLARSRRRGRTWSGSASTRSGGVLSLLALVRLPLFAVQAVVAASIGFVVLFAALIEKIRPTARQVWILVALGCRAARPGRHGRSRQGPSRVRPRSPSAVWIGVLIVGIAGVVAPRWLRAPPGLGHAGRAGRVWPSAAPRLCARAVETDTEPRRAPRPTR